MKKFIFLLIAHTTVSCMELPIVYENIRRAENQTDVKYVGCINKRTKYLIAFDKSSHRYSGRAITFIKSDKAPRRSRKLSSEEAEIRVKQMGAQKNALLALMRGNVPKA